MIGIMKVSCWADSFEKVFLRTLILVVGKVFSLKNDVTKNKSLKRRNSKNKKDDIFMYQPNSAHLFSHASIYLFLPILNFSGHHFLYL